MDFILLYCGLCLVNVVLQTVKSLCTVRCSRFVSACVNALAYGLYVYVIFYTNAEGLSLIGKAVITATANFIGVYIANILYDRIFKKEVRWKVEVSIPRDSVKYFEQKLDRYGLEWYTCGWTNSWKAYAVFCPNKETSKRLNTILPPNSKYNIVECVKRL